MKRPCLICVVAALCAAASAFAEMKQGTADLKSAGPIAFGPGVLFIGDPQAATVFAVEINDRAPTGDGKVSAAKIDGRIAGLLGTKPDEVHIADMAVNPTSGNVYFCAARGRGPTAPPIVLKLDRKGELTEVPLKDVKYDKAALSNAADGKNRMNSITGMAFANGKLYVAGLSTEEFNSTLRTIPFPFQADTKGTGVKIYHGAHGKFETSSPIRTFTTYEIAGDAHLLAAYQCTPLVRIPVSTLKPGEKVTGTTIAELGNGNKPLDMFVYAKGGKDYLLMSNTRRGVMKVELEKAGSVEGITTPIRGGGTAGLPYESVKGLKDVMQLAKLDAGHALVLVKGEDGTHDLETIELP